MDFNECWKRIQSATPIKNMSELAKIVGTSSSNMTKKKQKNVFPHEWAFAVGREYNLLIEWILTGEGPKSLDSIDHYDPVFEYADDAKHTYVECYWMDKFIKNVPIIVGALYKVDPINPSKKKHKGEKVILIEGDPFERFVCLRIDSEWHLTKRNYTEFDACDLSLLEEYPNHEELGFDLPNQLITEK